MLAQIKKQILYTLNSIEFAVSEAKAKEIMALMADDGSFSDLNYQDINPHEWSWKRHTDRLMLLTSNQKLLKDEAYRAKVLKCLDFFAEEHRHNDNWWHNDIGLPKNCGCIYLCLENHLTQNQKDILVEYVKQGSIALRPNVLTLWFGANLLWGSINTLYHAVIVGDLTLMKEALSAVAKELEFHDGSEGIQSDFSFFQHQTQFYTGGYGRSFIASIAVLVYVLQKTEYQFNNRCLSILGGYIISGARYCIRNNSYDFLTIGREIARPNGVSADSIRKALLLLLKVDEMPCKDVMQEQLASMCTEGYSIKGHKFFTESNYYSSSHVIYHIGCHGTSPLRSMGESINNENMLSANLYAGGATCIMVDGNEYRDIFPLWNFAHVPGTTAPLEPDEELIQKIPLWHGKNADNTYCRGVSHNNYGLMYQDLNFNGVKGVISRFFVDGVMIALGAGITCDSNHPLTTTLNQCHQYNEKILTNKDGLCENTVYQGRVGYASLDGQPIITESQYKEGGWSRINTFIPNQASSKICTFYINHGVQPENASYAYAVIPSISQNVAKEQIKEVVDQITVLRNDDRVQAIQYKKKIFCVFHKNDTLRIGMYDKLIGSAQSAYIL